MTTTGSTDFNLEFTEVAEEAWERATGGASELRSGYNLRTVRRSLNLLLAEWANRGLNMWTMEEGVLPLITGQRDYVLPPDTVDIMEQRVRQPGMSDILVSRVSVSTFAAIPNPDDTGRPLQVFIDRQRVAPIIKVWPLPDRDTYALVFWRLRRLEDAGTGMETSDVPFRFLPALIAGLAYMVATKVPEGMARLQLLKVQYDEAWMLASDEDREKAPIRIVPHVARL